MFSRFSVGKERFSFIRSRVDKVEMYCIDGSDGGND